MAELLLEFFFSSGITILRSSPMYMRQSQEAIPVPSGKPVRLRPRRTQQTTRMLQPQQGHHRTGAVSIGTCIPMRSASKAAAAVRLLFITQSILKIGQVTRLLFASLKQLAGQFRLCNPLGRVTLIMLWLNRLPNLIYWKPLGMKSAESITLTMQGNRSTPWLEASSFATSNNSGKTWNYRRISRLSWIKISIDKGYVGNEYSLSQAKGGYMSEERKLENVSRDVEALIESLNNKETEDET